ncbi:hypothetical protein SEUCBS140593_007424 [Sporothrix eucalyptigena]|uniref:Uncharacterized protein n=1 Tax=Sporothrix eucalyptigena TaxID=1812306 RepID=A0ABP0CD50_9PEZI
MTNTTVDADPTDERPSPTVAGLLVSDEFCPALTDPHLLRVARELLDAESGILAARIRAFNKTKANPDASTAAKRAILRDAETAYTQIEQVRTGTRRVGTLYLKQRHMLHFWTDMYNDWSNRLADPSKSVSIDWHIIHMNTLGDVIVQAATDSKLDGDVERLLEERWRRFEVFAKMNATTVSNTVTFALSYNYSTHTLGAWHEADFWALVQQAITQLIGLAITIVPLVKNKYAHRWAWQAPSIFVVCLTVVSIPLYVFVPTEWSSLTMLVGGAIQTFLTLQLAILGV